MLWCLVCEWSKSSIIKLNIYRNTYKFRTTHTTKRQLRRTAGVDPFYLLVVHNLKISLRRNTFSNLQATCRTQFTGIFILCIQNSARLNWIRIKHYNCASLSSVATHKAIDNYAILTPPDHSEVLWRIQQHVLNITQLQFRINYPPCKMHLAWVLTAWTQLLHIPLPNSPQIIQRHISRLACGEIKMYVITTRHTSRSSRRVTIHGLFSRPMFSQLPRKPYSFRKKCMSWNVYFDFILQLVPETFSGKVLRDIINTHGFHVKCRYFCHIRNKLKNSA